MSVLGVIAFITGTLGVFLTIKQNILCWPAALVSVLIATYEFYEARLYGDMFLQVFYFFAGVYGWIYWKSNQAAEFTVIHTKPSAWPFLVGATVLQFVVYYYLLRHFNGARPLLDAALTALSLTTTYMMTKKWVENWIFWVIIDGVYIALYFLVDLWTYGLLYLVFTIVAFFGWLEWRKLALKE